MPASRSAFIALLAAALLLTAVPMAYATDPGGEGGGGNHDVQYFGLYQGGIKKPEAKTDLCRGYISAPDKTNDGRIFTRIGVFCNTLTQVKSAMVEAKLRNYKSTSTGLGDVIAGKFFPATSCASQAPEMQFHKITVGGEPKMLCSVVLKLPNTDAWTTFVANNSSQWCFCPSQDNATVYSPSYEDRYLWTQMRDL